MSTRSDPEADSVLTPKTDLDHTHLKGRMGVGELLAAVLAFSAPVAIVSGYIPVVIVYSGAGAPAVYVAATALLLLFAVGFTTMSRYLPNPGAFYAYITAGIGRVIGLGAAFLAVYGYALLGFCAFPFFGLSTSTLVSDVLGGPSVAWYWYALVAWAICGLLAILKVEVSAKILTVAMTLEVLIVLIFDGAVLIQNGPQGRSLEPFGWEAFSSGNVGIAVLFAVTCFLGFEATAVYREEVKHPRKTIPRATYLAVVLIGLFYAGSAWLIITAFGIDNAPQVATDDPTAMFAAAMTEYVGTVGVDIVAVLLVTSLFASALSVQNVLARYVYSLGVDGAFPRAFAKVNQAHSPHIAVLCVSAVWFALGAVFIALGAEPGILYAQVAGVGGFVVLILMTLTSAAVVMFFRGAAHIKDSTIWHTLVAPSIATIGMVAVVWLAVSNFTTLIGGSMALAIVLQILTWGVLLTGVVTALLIRTRRPDVYRRIGRQGDREWVKATFD